MTLTPQATDALIVVDMQRDFMSGGPLAVRGAEDLVPGINALLSRFETRVFTRDWHPADHISFSPQPSFQDMSWPLHGVKDSPGAAFHPDLRVDLADRVVNKADRPDAEAYSGFQDTDLAAWLRKRGVQRVFVVGVASDYCVRFTALHALREGFQVVVFEDLVRAVDVPAGSGARALEELRAAGVRVSTLAEFDGHDPH